MGTQVILLRGLLSVSFLKFGSEGTIQRSSKTTITWLEREYQFDFSLEQNSSFLRLSYSEWHLWAVDEPARRFDFVSYIESSDADAHSTSHFSLHSALDGGAQVMIFILSFAVFGASGKERPFPTVSDDVSGMRPKLKLILFLFLPSFLIQWAGNPTGNPDYCNVDK